MPFIPVSPYHSLSDTTSSFYFTEPHDRPCTEQAFKNQGTRENLGFLGPSEAEILNENASYLQDEPLPEENKVGFENKEFYHQDEEKDTKVANEFLASSSAATHNRLSPGLPLKRFTLKQLHNGCFSTCFDTSDSSDEEEFSNHHSYRKDSKRFRDLVSETEIQANGKEQEKRQREIERREIRDCFPETSGFSSHEEKETKNDADVKSWCKYFDSNSEIEIYTKEEKAKLLSKVMMDKAQDYDERQIHTIDGAKHSHAAKESNNDADVKYCGKYFDSDSDQPTEKAKRLLKVWMEKE